MNYHKRLAVVIVAMWMLAPLTFANAKAPKGKASHKRAQHVDRHYRHENYHDRQRERHEKFHDKQRERHEDHHADELHDQDDDHHADRHSKFHDKQHKRHEKFHDKHRARHDDYHADDGLDDDHHAHHRDDHDADHHARDGHRPWNKQRLNEERKLQHHLDQAEHLRRISERNGNPRLAETADRMEQRALEHYDKRLQRIDQHPIYQSRDILAEQDHSAVWQPEPVRAEPTTRPLRSSLSEFSDGFQRRALSEQRELQQRLETADRLRQLGRHHGDPQLLEMADRIEGDAFEGFDRRIRRLGQQLPPNQQSQLNDFFERSVTDTLEREPGPMVSQSIEDLGNPILDQRVRYLLQDAPSLMSR